MGQSLSDSHLSENNENIHMNIQIEKVHAYIENKPTKIEEKSSSVLKYKTPYFRAYACVRFPPLEKGEIWRLGWIQACTKLKFENSYGSFGYSSWELPDLITKKKEMVSDSDGKQFPWYGSKTEVSLIKGPKSMHSVYEVRMNDNFYPHVTWDIPTSNEKIPRLTRVNREQSFLTWLVAMNVVTGRFLVLKTIKWHMLLELDIDPRKELGKRVRLVNGAVPSQPILLDKNIRIPKCALYPANANSSQYLVWRPSGHNSIPKIIVQPKSCNHHFKNDDKYQDEDEIINID